MPECLINPEISPLGKAVYNLVVLDAPEHENDASDDCKDQSVCKMLVKRQLDQISPQPQCSGSLDESREHPPGNMIMISTASSR